MGNTEGPRKSQLVQNVEKWTETIRATREEPLSLPYTEMADIHTSPRTRA